MYPITFASIQILLIVLFYIICLYKIRLKFMTKTKMERWNDNEQSDDVLCNHICIESVFAKHDHSFSRRNILYGSIVAFTMVAVLYIDSALIINIRKKSTNLQRDPCLQP